MPKVKALLLCLLLTLGIVTSSDATLQKVNFGVSTIVSDGGTTITIAAGDNALFPSSGQFAVTVWPATYSISSAPFREIIYLTHTSGDSYSTTRAKEGTNQFAWAKGDHLSATITAGVFNDYVLNSITVNGHALTDNISITPADLGLVISTNVQAYSSILTTYASVPPSSDARTLLGHTFAQMKTDLSLSAFTYPLGTGVVVVTGGAAWGTTLSVGTGASNLVQLNGSSQLPAVSATLLTNFPTLNQNTSGTAANLSGTPALPNGTTATTQSASDNSTKLATTAYVDATGNGKVSTSTTVNGHALSGNVTVTNADLGAVPTSRQVNGKALSSDITLSAGDIGITNPVTGTGTAHYWGVWSGSSTMGSKLVAPSKFVMTDANGDPTTGGGPSDASVMTLDQLNIDTTGLLIFHGSTANVLSLRVYGGDLNNNSLFIPNTTGLLVATPGLFGAHILKSPAANTGILEVANSSDVYGLFTGSHDSSHCLAGDGSMVAIGGGASVDNTDYNATSWDAVTTIAPSKNAVRDYFETLAPSGIVAVSHGGTGVADFSFSSTAHKVASSGITNPASNKCVEVDSTGTLQIAGTNAACGSGGSGMVYPTGSAGIANYNGSGAWGSQYNASNTIPANFIPTLNQNTSGTCSNVSGTPALPNGTTGTTQAAGSNDTKLATDAYADAKVSDTAYDATSWDGVTAIAPSKNAVRDYLESRMGSGSDGTWGLSVKNNTSTFAPASGYDSGFSIIGNVPQAYYSAANHPLQLALTNPIVAGTMGTTGQYCTKNAATNTIDCNTTLSGGGNLSYQGTIAANALVAGYDSTHVQTVTTGTGAITALGNAVNASGGLLTYGNAAGSAAVLTGFSSSAGTVAPTDTILQAINKLDGNTAAKAPLASPSFTGTTTLPDAPSCPTYSSTSTATGNINIDGAAYCDYNFSNGTTAATYTPVITAAPASGKVRFITLTVGGGTGVDTMTWTHVTFMGTTGAAATTTSKKSTYACKIPVSGNALCSIVAEAY